MATTRLGDKLFSCMETTLILWIAIDVVLSQTITEGPVNTAALVGMRSTLTCRVDNLGGDILEWSFYPNGTTQAIRAYLYSDIDEQKPDIRFDVDSSLVNQGIFDLIIKESADSVAGEYQCKIVVVNVVRIAKFVAVDDIQCDPPPGEKEVTVGTYVDLICGAGYVGYKPPALIWSTDSADFPGKWEWDGDSSRLTSNVTADAMYDGMVFTCDLGFIADGSEPGDPPTYNDSCSTYFRVLHGATSITITPDPDPALPVAVAVGDWLNCSASGNPEPEITWEGTTGEYTMDDWLQIIPEWANQVKTFTCQAQNFINGVPSTARLNITVSIGEAVVDPVTTSGIETWVIVVAVVVPVVVIAVAVIVACVIIKKKKKTSTKAKAYQADIPREVMGPGTGMQSVSAHPQAAPRRGPPGPGGRPPPGAHGRPTANGAMPKPRPVSTSGVDTAPVRSGKDSPGYGDLGIKQFGSLGTGLDASIDFLPDPHQMNNPKISQSRGSIDKGYQNIPDGMVGQPPPRQQQNPYVNQPPQGSSQRRPSQASVNRLPMAQGPMGSQASLSYMMPVASSNMGSQASLNRMTPARGNAGSQASLSRVPPPVAARGPMGSQGSLGRMPPARGAMGSQASLASQGHAQLQLADIPDTEV